MTLTDSPVVGAAGSAVDRVWNALDAGGFKPESIRGDKFMALCPVHGDTHRSLSVKFDRRREAVLLNCFTCHADYRDVASAIGLSATDLFDAPLPEKDAPRPAKGKPKFEPAHRVPRRITGLVDRGEGIAPERRDAIFQPFQRLGDTDNTTGLGLGLGVGRLLRGGGGTPAAATGRFKDYRLAIGQGQ